MKIKELGEKIIESVSEAIHTATGEKYDAIALSFPPDPELGDFSMECFSLAKKMQKSPAEIASLIASSIKPDEIIKRVSAAGPYVNIVVEPKALFSILSEIVEGEENFENPEIGKDEKIMVEYLGPNTNKPLHLGHARNGCLGMALSTILQKSGYEVLKANIINDRGVHICKSMLAYQKWGDRSTPESMNMKGDHFVGYWYVKYSQEFENNPLLEQEIQDMLQKWEHGDKETRALWKQMNEWVYAGWKTTLSTLGFEFNVVNYESETYTLGKDIVEKGLEKGVFQKNEAGTIVFDLPEKEFGLNKDGSTKKVTVLRSDGTSVYITQDIGTAVSRVEKHDLTRLIYVVGSEQQHHFKCLFKILDALGYEWAKNLFHLSYGMITLPEGKMKSREGKVVDTDDLIKELKKLGHEEVTKRLGEEIISEAEIEERAQKIALGAIKFYFLRVGANQDIEFNPAESVSFDGFTGPYCQYAYARIASIVRKAGKIKHHDDYEMLGNTEERLLLKKIIEFPDVIVKAGAGYNPSLVAIHTFETAQLFNKFYQKHPVLNAENEKLKNARLELIQAVQTVIKSGLELLGIETLEKM